MRNLPEYPITYEEAIKTLDELYQKEFDKMNADLVCGDMSCNIILWIKDQMMKMKENKL